MSIAQYSMNDLAQFVGKELGASPWITVDQAKPALVAETLAVLVGVGLNCSA